MSFDVTLFQRHSFVYIYLPNFEKLSCTLANKLSFFNGERSGEQSILRNMSLQSLDIMNLISYGIII